MYLVERGPHFKPFGFELEDEYSTSRSAANRVFDNHIKLVTQSNNIY